MNELIIVAVLFVPVLIIILATRFAQKQNKKKTEEGMLLYLKNTHPDLNMTDSRLTWQKNQLVAVFPTTRQLAIIRKEGPIYDSVAIPLSQVSTIMPFQQTEEMKQEGPNRRQDRVVLKYGLTISYNNKTEHLAFFDYKNDMSSSLPEKEAEATRFKHYLLDLIHPS